MAGENDLYGLAQTVAALTGGLVSIEDERSQLLAYSATDGAADELRMLSILGRAGPADYLRRLRERGVFDRLRPRRGAVEVPADERLGWRRRLVVDIRPLGSRDASNGQARGLIARSARSGSRRASSRSIPDAESVLEGAAAIAARLIDAGPQRADPGGAADPATARDSAAAAWTSPRWPRLSRCRTTGPAAVVGIAAGQR